MFEPHYVRPAFSDSGYVVGDNYGPEDLEAAKAEMEELVELFGPQANIGLGLKPKKNADTTAE